MKVSLYSLLLIIIGSVIAIVLRPRPSIETLEPLTQVSASSFPVFAVGIVEGRTPSIEIRFETSGRVLQVNVSEGDRVRRGDCLAMLDAEELGYRRDLAQAQLSQAHADWAGACESREEEITIAQAALDAKQAVLDREEKSLVRFKTLLANQATPQQQFDDQLATVTMLQAEVRSLKAKLKLLQKPSKPEKLQSLRARISASEAELRLSELEYRRAELLAPSDGVVLKVDVQAGELVASGDPLPAIVMVDDSQLEIKAFVEEADAWVLEKGLKVEVRRRSESHQPPIVGEISRVGPQFDEKKILNRRPDERFDVRTRECWISLDGHRDLVLGAHVDVFIHAKPSGAGSR